MDHKRKRAEYIMRVHRDSPAQRSRERRPKRNIDWAIESRERVSRLVATALPLRKTSGLFYGAVKYDLGFN